MTASARSVALPRSALGTRLADLGAVAPAGVAAVLAWLAWAALDGGFPPARWGPLGLGLVLLLAVVAVARPPRASFLLVARLVMALALTAFIGWAFVSMTWADFPADAWEGADKILVYCTGFALLALWPWRPRGLALLLGLFALGVTLVGAVLIATLVFSDDPASSFQRGRLIGSTGYVNASVALWMLAFWPAVWLGSTRRLPAFVRPIFIAAATLLLELALLGQSRGWLAILPIALALFLLLSRERLRTLLALGIVGAATLAAAPTLLDVQERPQALTEPLSKVGTVLLASCAAAAAAGAIWSYADRRVSVGRRARLGVAAGLVVLAFAALAAGGLVAAREVGDDPGDWISARWADFKGTEDAGEGGTRLTGSLATNRYDEWRVAWLEFRDHPAAGIGEGNYAAAYLARRKDNSDARYAPSIPLRLLSQLGLVGTALLGIVVAIAIALALRARRRLEPAWGGAIGAAVTVFAYWLLHGSIDWLWEIPAVSAPALGLLAAASATTARPPPEPERPLRRTRALVAMPALAVALAAGGALVPLWLSDSYAAAATRAWSQDLGLAYERLSLAAELNPLAAQPLVLEGSIALKLRDAGTARRALSEALEREPKNWYAHLQLALLAGYEGRYRLAERHARAASVLNPRDSIVGHARRLIERRREVDPDRVNGLYLRRLNTRAGRTIYPEWQALGPE